MVTNIPPDQGSYLEVTDLASEVKNIVYKVADVTLDLPQI